MQDKLNEKIDQEPKNKLARTAAQTAMLMAILTLVSKLLGFVREMVMAAYFGTSYITDAYVMAQSIPSIIFAGIFGSVATAYMPLFSQRAERTSLQSGNVFTSQVINILLVVSVISAVIGFVFSEQIVLVATDFTGETAELTSFFLKVTFAYTMFTSVSGILEAYLQYKNTFLPQIIVGYTQNFVMIVTIILSAWYSYYLLAFGLLLAYIIRIVLIWYLAWRKGFSYGGRQEKAKSVIKEIAILALPVFIGSSVSQINLFVDKYLASGLLEGSVSALNYASLLNNMVMTLSITILTTMIYPRLTQASSKEEFARFNQLTQKGFNLIILLSLPFSLGAMVYSGEIVQIVFERGAFDGAATALTGSAYLYYSVGMLFMALNTLFTQIYYSLHDMKTPMIFAGVGVIINICLNLALVGSMQHNGLALATSLAAACNSVLLYSQIRKKQSFVTVIQSKRKVLIIAVASVVSVGASYGIFHLLVAVIWLPRMIYLGVAVGAAMGIYLALLKLFKIKELAIIRDLLKR